MCNKERNKQHKQKTRLIGHYFKSWTDIHEIIKTQLEYTFTRGQYRTRHDRVYMKENTAQITKSYEIKATNISDHDQARLQMMWGKRPKWGKGSWTISNEILKDEIFQHETLQATEIYKLNKQCYEQNKGWDIFKTAVKEITQTRARQIRQQKQDEIKEIENELQTAKTDLDNIVNIEISTERIKEIARNLDDRMKEKMEGERIRSKQDKILYDERSTKYYHRKEKMRDKQSKSQS